MKRIFILFSVALISFFVSSCGSQPNENPSTNTNTPQNINEPSTTESVVKEEPKANPIDRFVGKYNIVGENEIYVEVLSDGRVLCCSYRRSDDKSFMGNVKVVSDNAFVLSPSEGSLYYYGGTPEYRIIDGVETEVTSHSEGGGAIPARYLVFDIGEKRIYTKGYSKYMNRDVCGTEYMKIIR